MPEPANPSRIGPPHRSAVSAPFTWPPKPLPTEPDRHESCSAIVESPSQQADPPLHLHRRTRGRSAWAEIEQFWFDPIILPLDRRIEQTGWMPELIDDFCDRCGLSIGLYEGDEFGCSACRGSRPPWQRLIRLGPYAPPLSDWILDIKFQQWRSGASGLGLRLAERLVQSGVRERLTGPLIIVPAPMALPRRLARGIDHAAAIARSVARALDGRFIRALAREHRPSQRAVPASLRRANVAGAVRVRRGVRLPPDARIILVDDVLTSGSTLRVCARALERASESRGGRGPKPEIWGAVIAVTPDDA